MSNPDEKNKNPQKPPVYLVDGARTPFLKVRGGPGPFSPVDLAVQCGRPLLLRQNFAPDAFDRVILGCVNVVADEMNPARVAALRLGMGEAMRAHTVQINCGSGMQSIDSGLRLIRDGAADLVLAGGAEALSHAPLLFREEAVEWLAELRRKKSLQGRARNLARLRPGFLVPELGLEKGLTDPIAELNMGQTAENIAHPFRISREAADLYALQSHKRLARAQQEGDLDAEIEPAVSTAGELFEKDDGVRPDSTLESLARLRPVFERPYGKVTAGNSSQVTDGASWVILASQKAVERHNLKPLALIREIRWAALDPGIMGLTPVPAIAELLSSCGLGMGDIDLWELNEAFAVQVLACQAALDDGEFCRTALGRQTPLGSIDPERLNVDGGAISLGHPVGASGNRIVLHLAHALRRRDLRRGVATACIGGGQAGALLLESVRSEE